MGLRLHNLGCRAGSQWLLRDIQLEVSEDELVLVVGANGAGKTTLLRRVLGLARGEGSASWDARDLAHLRPRERAEYLAWLPQHPVLVEPVSAEEWVSMGRFRFSETRAASMEAAQGALQELGALGFAGRLVNTLSGGERQRVALATLVAQQARFWLLDEPASALDPGMQESVYRMLMDRWREGQGMLLVTHDLDLSLRVLEPGELARVRVLGLADGGRAFECALADEGLPGHLSGLYGVQVRWIDLGRRRGLAIVGAP